MPSISERTISEQVEQAKSEGQVLLGHDIHGEPQFWSHDTRTYQANCFGMTGAGKTTLIQSITEQDLASGAPIILIDGKG